MDAAGGQSQDMCITADVIVEGKPAVWIFTEFETEESLADLSEWLKPENWPTWGGSMFKEMRPTGRVVDVPSLPGEVQSHAKYLEVVQLGGRELNTVLHCDIKSTQKWAAMSYDLDHSVGDMLQVDRGYLMALDVAGRRQVKALKIVGFTDTLLNALATTVCPEWGRWVRHATSVAATLAAGGSVDPRPGSVGDADPSLSDPDPAGAAAFTGGFAEQWVSTVTDMAQFYGEYASDVGTRLWSGKYGQTDAAHDSSRLFLRLARDWSRAWQAGMDATANWADAEVEPTAGGDASVATDRRTVGHTSLLVPPQTTPSAVAITDLRRVGVRASTIKASDITVTPSTVEAGDSPEHVTVQVDTTTVPCGLYEGELIIGTSGMDRVPALFYVSKARPDE